MFDYAEKPRPIQTLLDEFKNDKRTQKEFWMFDMDNLKDGLFTWVAPMKEYGSKPELFNWNDGHRSCLNVVSGGSNVGGLHMILYDFHMIIFGFVCDF